MPCEAAVVAREKIKKEYRKKQIARFNAADVSGRYISFYSTLDLEPSCTQRDIKVRYMKLAKTHHQPYGHI